MRTVEVDFLAPHRPRHAGSPRQTEAKTRELLGWMQELGRVAPVHYQEPFRRGFSGQWDPSAEDFAADLRQAIAGGAAGWCLHNGDQREQPDGRPRRSFDLRKGRLFDRLDDEERAFLDQHLPKVLQEMLPGHKPTTQLTPAQHEQIDETSYAAQTQGEIVDGRPHARDPVTAIPVLTWEARLDWMNVREYGVKGDGATDDTAAIQAVLDRTVETDANYAESLRHRVVYFPAGRYRLTKTLVLAKSHGAWLVGHGRDTVLVWDGAEQGIMLWNNGATYAHYEGLTWGGQGKAAVGVEHKSMHYYETCMRYQHCAFLNFTEHGVLVGRGDEKVATAEMWFLNCLFRNCGNGVSFCNFNDYDNTFDGCQFEDCGVGVNSVKGNFYLRASRFFAVGIVTYSNSLRRTPAHCDSARHRAPSVSSVPCRGGTSR